MKPSLLYISYYFPPIKSIAVKRNYFLAKGLRNYFGDVQVLTTSNYKSLDQEAMPLDGLSVKYLATFDYRTILAKFRRKKSTHFSEEKKSGWIVQLFIRLNESFPFNLLIGEGGIIYILHGLIEGIRILKKKDKKIIITSFRPFSNVCIGYLLKIRYPKADWVVSFHDFPIENLRKNVILKKLQFWVWKKFLSKCNKAFTVSNGITHLIQAMNPNVITIMNGIIPRKSVNQNSKKFRIVYTGSIYLGFRDPTLLFRSFSEMVQNKMVDKNKVELIYAGKDNTIWNKMISSFSLNEVSLVLNDLPTHEALALQESAHLNVLLTWATHEQKGILTGKLFEYLGCGNPVLAIINGTNDQEITSLFDEIGCGKVVSSDDLGADDHIKTFIKQLYQDWENGKSFPSYYPNLKEYSWEHQVERLAEFVLHP
ncbi:MAG: hypothetical protein IPK35_17960 [Saprospiraceae bacterium]|nr:hypothetical protein [Saprospiraceae bacterium]